MVVIDWTAVGSTLTTVGLIAGGIWAALLQAKKNRAETRAEVAANDASRAIADAQQDVFRLLTVRLTALEEEVKVLRSELSEERSLSRKLHIHIFKLEDLMRNHNIDPPEFDYILP